MPERSFGRTVRYRRTKLGLSQSKLGELVGRSTATVRSWERDNSRPTDPDVLATLAAILGVSERQLFDKAEVDIPDNIGDSPTVEQALATLSPAGSERAQQDPAEREPPVSVVATDTTSVTVSDELGSLGASRQSARHVGEAVGRSSSPAYVAPPDPYVRTAPTPTLADASYIEDQSQRQMYRVRTLATLVVLVALVVALIWAIQEGFGALDAWWDEFFGNLRL
ncbi:MAG TPA: helix-turn-helix domain-containing protein [Acidimicrobiia bacterium]